MSHPEKGTLLWEEHVPAGAHWSGVLRRGTTLRVKTKDIGSNVSMIFYNYEEKLERYNMPDTLKAQKIAYLTKDIACYSDMGRLFCSITEDTVGWHDTMFGVSNAKMVDEKYGIARYQEHHNDYHKNGFDSLINEISKYGLDKRDLGATVNLFSKVTVDEEGGTHFISEHSKADDYVDLRFEMNTLVALTTCQHPLDPNDKYDPKPVDLIVNYTGTADKDDSCRNRCGENQRCFTNTDRLFI